MTIKIRRRMLPAEFQDTRTLICDACGREETPHYEDTQSISTCNFCGATYCDPARNRFAADLCCKYTWAKYDTHIRVCEKCSKLRRVMLLLNQHRRAADRYDAARRAYNKVNDRLIEVTRAARAKYEAAIQIEVIPVEVIPAPQSESESESEE